MEITGVLSAILVGIAIGVLGRLALPGRQRIGMLATILVGCLAALLGTAFAHGFDVADTEGVDWIELFLQIGLAALGVGSMDRGSSRRSWRSRGRRRSRMSRRW